MDYKHILLDVSDQVAVITMNRPKLLNAMSLEMKEELYDALGQIEADENILAAILTGSGRAFCSGHDNNDNLSCMPKFVRLQEEERLYHLKKPIIAAVNGYALGDGLQQALLCDMIVAAEEAIMAFNGPEVGGFCYGSFTALPEIVGRHRANELILTCKRVSAQEGYQIGLVNRVVPKEKLMETAMEIARTIAKLPAKSIYYSKAALKKPLTDESHKIAIDQGWNVILEDVFQSTDNQQ